MDTRDDGSPLQSMRRLFWCSLQVFFVQVFSYLSGIFHVPPAGADEGKGKEARTPRAPARGLRPPAPPTQVSFLCRLRWQRKEKGRKRGHLALRPGDCVPRHPLLLCVAYGERRKRGRQADFAKTQKSSAAARRSGRKVQEPECGPLHE